MGWIGARSTPATMLDIRIGPSGGAGAEGAGADSAATWFTGPGVPSAGGMPGVAMPLFRTMVGLSTPFASSRKALVVVSMRGAAVAGAGGAAVATIGGTWTGGGGGTCGFGCGAVMLASLGAWT